jgi:hypothetical protein
MNGFPASGPHRSTHLQGNHLIATSLDGSNNQTSIVGAIIHNWQRLSGHGDDSLRLHEGQQRRAGNRRIVGLKSSGWMRETVEYKG